MNTSAKQLLSVIELGGYPNFAPIYQSSGYEVTTVKSVRNAIREIKKIKPDVVVAEFNFQSDFRDRTSSLESLLSTLQWQDNCDVIVFYEQEYAHQLERLTQQYALTATLPFPVDQEELKRVIEQIS